MMFVQLKEKLNSLELNFASFEKKFHIKNVVLKKYVANAFFVIVLLASLNYIGVFKFINNRPSSVHLSAQSQRASIALNYYKDDMNFFKPKIQRYIKGEGVTGGEFPIIYYAGAIMYKLFGFNEMYLRLISLIIVAVGFVYFNLLVRKFIKSKFLSALIVLAGALSPVLLFYTPNFMPDAPSLGFTLMAWYFFFNYYETGVKKELIKFILFATLASLIKATAILTFMVILCLLILDKLNYFKTEGKIRIFNNHIKIFVYIFFGVVIVIGWYQYANWLTNYYGNKSFALSPIMVDSWEGLMGVFEYVKNLWLNYYYAYEAYVLLISALIAIILLYKYVNRLLFTITMLNILGSIGYIYFFLNQFKHHDYYIIAMLPSVFFLLLTFADALQKITINYYYFSNAIIIVALFFNVKESMRYCKKVYYERNTRAIYYWTGDYRAYEDIEPKLRKLNIKRTDKFISAFDYTYCGSLYLMDQIGTTVDRETPEDVKTLIDNPEIKYLVLNDSAKFNKNYPGLLQGEIVLMHRGLIVYRLPNK